MYKIYISSLFSFYDIKLILAINFFLSVDFSVQRVSVKLRSVDISKFPKDRKVRSRQDKNHSNIKRI